MEELLKYVNRIEISEDLLEKCNVQLIKADDIKLLKCNNEKFDLKLKIAIEYEVFYDKLYIGKWSDVVEELRQLFLKLSFLKVR